MVPLRSGIDVHWVWAQPSFRPGRLPVFAALGQTCSSPFGARGTRSALSLLPSSLRSQCHQVDTRHYGASRLLQFLIPFYYLQILLNWTSLACTSDSITCLGEASHICLKYWTMFAVSLSWLCCVASAFICLPLFSVLLRLTRWRDFKCTSGIIIQKLSYGYLIQEIACTQ